MNARIKCLKDALRGLIKECEQADHWIRHTDAFEFAQSIMRDEDGTE